MKGWVGQFVYAKRRYEVEKPMKEDIKFPSSSEKESAIIICSEEPEAVAEKIARLSSIDDYRLLPQETKEIHDIYFDSPKSELKAEKMALRIREIGAMQLITLKGPPKLTDWGGVERLEIEKPWCERALADIFKKLKKKIEVPELREDFDWAHPQKVMTSMDLQVIQDRKTQRQVRNIVFHDEENSPTLAELAIDSVVYDFDNKKIHHYEVEIEAKLRDIATVVKAVSVRLVEMFEPALREWDHNKLTTGEAIQKLIAEGALEELLDDNNLRPEAYDKIDEYLKTSKV